MKDNIVLYPHPSRGHLISMLELGKLISKHNPSISITVIILNTPNHNTFSQTHPTPTFSENNPSIKFIHLPPIKDPTASSSSDHRKLNNPNLHDALLFLSKTSNVKAFITDFFCSVSIEVSSDLNIPSYFFYTSNASVLCHFLYWYVIDKEINWSKRNLDELLVDVPGTTTIGSEHVPTFMLDSSLNIYKDLIETANLMAESAGIIVNTFEFLERKAVKALEEGKCTPYHVPPPPIYCVGPLLFTDETKEQHESLVWLDSQPDRSVVFLCFGSQGTVIPSASQLKEIAIGLENSGVRFVWVVRNPPEEDGEEPNLENLLPEGFLERSNGRGIVVKSWAPQSEILNHESVGGFVTHCGWNSILETVCAGVPMLAWPLYAEQKMNKMFLVDDMKLALPIIQSKNGWVSAEELEERLIELMKSEKGDIIRKQVLDSREVAMKAMSDGGSSNLAINRLIRGLN
ncbi:UDP-glycosyltransferase 88B1-like [Euphorbia lathyris]|uniref:UDP-glycosyltransferase 88B1-like n=1 Tax=Euphorbia lathyris TaxID=212925 RepID=UPI003314114A